MKITSQDIVKNQRITRLCHFTKSVNLPYILGEGGEDFNGIISNLKVRESKFLEINDVNRYDGKPELICTSVEYPNFFFFETSQKRSLDSLLSDWVVILIKPDVIDENTYFCPVNAATGRGKYIRQGAEHFSKLFAESIEEFQSKCPFRNRCYPNNVPTDLQAEVLFEKDLPPESIIGLVFSSESQASLEKLRLRLCNVHLDNIKFYFSEDFFRKDAVGKLQNGTNIELYPLEE